MKKYIQLLKERRAEYKNILAGVLCMPARVCFFAFLEHNEIGRKPKGPHIKGGFGVSVSALEFLVRKGLSPTDTVYIVKK